MALGGGTFTVQNKVLPGSYINFVSTAASAVTLSDRGIVAMPLEFDWCVDGEIFEVTQEDFLKQSLSIFGYAYDHEKMKGLRDLFLNAQKAYFYKLNSEGAKATSTFGTAKHSGIRGNDLNVVVEKNVDDETLFDVEVYLGTSRVDKQTVAKAADLVDNEFIKWDTAAELYATAGLAFEGGTNGTVDGAKHQAFLDAAETYGFNTLGLVSTDETIQKLYAAYVKRMRDSVGVKFQVVMHDYAGDYEGIINVKNKVIGDDSASLVYWVTGAEAGCAVNKSITNKKYDGEFSVEANYTQTQLEKAIKAGEFVFHKVGDDINVLTDINSLVTVVAEKNELFQSNQTVRVIDQIGNDIAVMFNTKYIGKIANDASGRISLWTDIVKYMKELQTIRAIEGFEDDDIEVLPGATKTAVVVNTEIFIVNAMEKLYMTVNIE